jgi:hypothetical protein
MAVVREAVLLPIPAASRQSVMAQGFPWAPFGAVLIGICASIAAADAFGFAALTDVLPGRADRTVLAFHKDHPG